MVQIRRDLLQAKIVVLMAMRAAHCVEVLPLLFLLGELRLVTADRHRAPNQGSKHCEVETQKVSRAPCDAAPREASRAASHVLNLAAGLVRQLRYAGNMILPTLDQIEDAQAIVYRSMPPTPQYSWPLINQRLGLEAWVKHENHTPVGAFKLRGALVYLEWLKRTESGLVGVVAATRGNHGQGVGMAAKLLGLKAAIVVPKGNSIEKNLAMRALEVELIEFGYDFQESLVYARTLAGNRDWAMIDSFHQRLVMGTSTYALEFFRGAPKLDAIYVPIGLGSSICGVAAVRNALDLNTEIVGVVASQSPSYALSFRQKTIVEAPAGTAIADGLACRTPHPTAMDVIWKNVSRVVEVSDVEIAEAMRAYYQDTHNVAEGAAAAPLAAAMRESSAMQGKRIGLVLTGSNVDSGVLARVLTGSFGQ